MTYSNAGYVLPRVRTSVTFHRSRVLAKIKRQEKRFLYRAGGATRKTVRNLIRSRKSISVPGRPPSSHTGKLKNTVLFAVDLTRKVVRIGPSADYKSFTQIGQKRGAALLEFGGHTVQKDRITGEIRRMFYRRRPYMKPGLSRIKPHLPRYFAEAGI